MGDAERAATAEIDLKGESGPIVEFKDVTIKFDVKPVLEGI